MNRTAVTALVGGGALAALALIGSLLRSEPAGGAAERNAAAGPADAARAKAALERPDELAAGADAAPEGAEVDARATRRGGDEARTALAGASGVLALDFVDPDGAPVPDTEVWLLQGASKATLKAYQDAEDHDAWMRAKGALRTADAAGRLVIAVPRGGPTKLVARAGDLWARESIGEDEEGPVRVQLERDQTLSARVVDTAGTPVAGVTVEIRSLRHSWSHVADDRETDADGLARFPHVQNVIRYDEDRTWVVGIEAALDPWVQEPVDPRAWPAGPVTLVLPATGEVELLVLDEYGEPLAGAGTATLGIVREGQPRQISPFGGERRQRVERDVVDGVARFPHVGLGLELELAAQREGSNVDTHVYGPGPLAPGQTAAYELRLGSDHPVVRLRAVDGKGAPLAQARVQVRIDYASRHMQNANEVSFVTDEQGYGMLDLQGHWTEGTVRTLTFTMGPRNAPQGTAQLDLSRKLGPGVTDLGDVVIAAAPLFVAGRLVDSRGAGVEDAQLVLRYRTGDRTWWEEAWDFSHETGPDGRFEVRGTFAGDEFKLGAKQSSQACPMVVFEPGERNVQLALQAGGFVVGSILMDERIPHDALHVDIRGAEGWDLDYLSDTNGRTSPGDDGAFRLGPLLPGTYRVDVRLEGADEPLLRVEDVVVGLGETVRDPRLDRVDLRGRLFVHELTLVQPEGDTDRVQGGVQYGPAGAEELEGSSWLDGTDVRIVCEDEAVDVVVGARGYRVERREGVRGEATFQLRKGLSVRLVLRGGARIPDPPVYVKAGLTRPESTFEDMDWGAPAFDEEREIVVKVPAAGRLRVSWVLEKRSANSAVATMANLEEEEFVEVLDVDGVQTIELNLTDDEMQEILGALD